MSNPSSSAFASKGQRLGEAPSSGSVTKGQVQPRAYRDGIFAILFILQLVAVVAAAIFLGPKAFSGMKVSAESRNMDLYSFWSFMTTSFLCAVVACLGFLTFIVQFSRAIVNISFFASPVLTALAALAIFLSWGIHDANARQIAIRVAQAALGEFAIMGLFYLFSRKYILFADSTLRTALAAVRDNVGLLILSFLFMLITNAWIVVWTIAAVGSYYTFQSEEQVLCSDLGLDDPDEYPEGSMCTKESSAPPQALIIFFLVSFYWTQETIKNLLHTTTAGTVGSWCVRPGRPGICSQDITDSLYRASTFSFGSVCLGSLFVAVLQTLEQLVREKKTKKKTNEPSRRRGQDRRRDHDRNDEFRNKITKMILSWIRRLMDYFNTWAFVYVGLYGYGYMTAGKAVMNLFRQRGWTNIISDRLVYRVLLFCNIVISITSGCIALLVNSLMGPSLGEMDAAASYGIAFVVAFVWGMIMANISLFVVESAVRTVIVCFAEAPGDLERTHPKLSLGMNQGWSQAYSSVWKGA